MHAFSILAQDSDSGGSSAISFLIFPVLLAVMYFVMIRPQRKRMKEQNALQSAIEVGDEVITNSGIYGFVTGVDGDRFWLEIDDDVQIRIARAAIQRKVNTAADDDDDQAVAEPRKAIAKKIDAKPDSNKPDSNKPDSNKPDRNKPDRNKPGSESDTKNSGAS